MITIKKYNELSSLEVYKILQARSEVFVVEQKCIYQDIDSKDIDGIHCFIKNDDNNIIAYLRILGIGVSYKDASSIGRVLVTLDNRGKGYAKIIMKAAVKYLFEELHENIIMISAQKYLESFYSTLGFVTKGIDYLEDDIPHIKMILKKK